MRWRFMNSRRSAIESDSVTTRFFLQAACAVKIALLARQPVRMGLKIVKNILM